MRNLIIDTILWLLMVAIFFYFAFVVPTPFSFFCGVMAFLGVVRIVTAIWIYFEGTLD